MLNWQLPLHPRYNKPGIQGVKVGDTLGKEELIKRKKYSKELKVKVAVAGIKGHKTINETVLNLAFTQVW